MKLRITFLQPSLKLLVKHASFLALLLSLLFNGWLVWQGWEQWQEHPLPPERVQAKQLRVNESARLKLIQDITVYHQPAAVDQQLPSGIFGRSGS